MYSKRNDDGIIAFNDGAYEKASALFQLAINNNPEMAGNYFYLGKCHFLNHKKVQAISPLKTFCDKTKTLIEQKKASIAEQENVAYAFDMLGQCYEAGGNDVFALKSYQTATTIYPACASAWNNKGLFYIKSALSLLKIKNLEKCASYFEAAKEFIQKALLLCQDNPMFLHSVGRWYEQYIELLEEVIEEEEAVQKNITNNFGYALQYYQKALDACKENDFVLKGTILENRIECLAQYGHHQYRNEQYKQAEETYLSVITLDPIHLQAISQLGMTFFKQGEYTKAHEYFSSILEKTDESQELADAWLNIACTYRFEKKWDQAQEALDKAKQLAPEDAYITAEQKELHASRPRLTSSLQTLFGETNTSSQDNEKRIENASTNSPKG